MTPFQLFLFVFIGWYADAKTLHLWAIRHVESCRNAFVNHGMSVADIPTPPFDPEPPLSIPPDEWKQFDQPPSPVNGSAQLKGLLSDFGRIALAGPRQQLTDATAIQFYGSDLVRTQLTALTARESLLRAADEPMKKKIKASPFTICQNLRRKKTKPTAFNGASRFKKAWRQTPTGINGGAMKDEYSKYLQGALPARLQTEWQGTEANAKLYMQPITLQYEGHPDVENPPQTRTPKRLTLFGEMLKGQLGTMGAADKKIIIAGVHSGWFYEFVEEYATPEAHLSYKKLCGVIGDKKQWKDPAKKYFLLDNRAMVDMTIEVEGTRIKIVEITGYDLGNVGTLNGGTNGGVINPTTRVVDVSAVTLPARFESFGDVYIDYDDVDYDYDNADDGYDDGYFYGEDYEQEEEDDEDDAYYYDLLNYVLSLIK